MLIPRQTAIPDLARVKPGALDRMDIYAERHEFMRVMLFFSQGFDDRLMARLTASLRSRNIEILQQTPVESISFEKVTELFCQSPRDADAIIGFGEGKRWMSPNTSHFSAGFPVSPCQHRFQTTASAALNPA